MTQIGIFLVVVAVAIGVVNLFAYSGLLVQVRRIQDAVLTLEPPRTAVDQLIGRGTAVVLATEENCFSCRERLAEISALGDAHPEIRFYVFHVGGDGPSEFLSKNISFVNDPAAVGALGVGMFPTAIIFDWDGTERARSIVGDQPALEALVGRATEVGVDAGTTASSHQS